MFKHHVGSVVLFPKFINRCCCSIELSPQTSVISASIRWFKKKSSMCFPFMYYNYSSSWIMWYTQSSSIPTSNVIRVVETIPKWWMVVVYGIVFSSMNPRTPGLFGGFLQLRRLPQIISSRSWRTIWVLEAMATTGDVPFVEPLHVSPSMVGDLHHQNPLTIDITWYNSIWHPFTSFKP